MSPRLPLAPRARALLASAATTLVGLLVLGSLAACRQLAGITDSPPEDLTSTACGLPYGANACASCVHANCCAESTTCAADPVCSAYEGCLGDCNGDAKCRSQCTIDHPVGTASDVSALSACLAAKCETPCGLMCGSIAALVSPPDASASCESCLQTNACSQAQACASSAECDARIRCWLACSTQECEDSCAGVSAYERDFSEAGTLESIGIGRLISNDDPISGVCGTQCAAGDNWACVGHVSWPLPTSTKATIDLDLADYGMTSMRLQGIDVSVCSPQSPDCSSPLAVGTTNALGFVSLQFANALDTAGQTGLNGYLQLESPDIVTTLLYWGFPLVGDAVGYWTATAPSTPAENQQLDTAASIPPDPSPHGTLAAGVFDCVAYFARGVQITLSTAITDALTQSNDRTGAKSNVTGPGGLLFFSNVPVGAVEVTATPPGLGRPSSRVTAQVRKDAVTVVYLSPTP